MKNTTRILSILLFGVSIMACTLSVSAQKESDIASFIKAGKQDANVLITGYTAPLVKGASYGATGGWVTTAKTHKTLGFDLGVSMTLAFTPTSNDYFSPTGLSSSTKFENTTNPDRGAPTFLGPKDHTTYTISSGQGSVSFSGPEGLNLRHYVHFAAVPVPMIQLGIGVIKNTDVKLRYVPSITRGNSKASLFGIGVMHDVKQYLPGSEFLPFDLSVLVAYASIKGTTSLVNSDPNSSAPTSADGAFHYKLNSWVGQAIISKKLGVITFYGAAGFGSVTTNADITGTFAFTTSDGTVTATDPFATKFKNKSAKLTGGVRLKLGPVYFVGDYTLQTFNALTVGGGVSIR